MKLFTGTCPGCNSHFASEKKILPGIICPACRAEKAVKEQERLEAAERCHYQNLNDRGIL